jgi:hypothetical protein
MFWRELRTLFVKRAYLEALFIRNIYNGFVAYPTPLEAVGIRVLARNIRDFNTFSLRFHVIYVLLFAVS